MKKKVISLIFLICILSLAGIYAGRFLIPQTGEVQTKYKIYESVEMLQKDADCIVEIQVKEKTDTIVNYLDDYCPAKRGS